MIFPVQYIDNERIKIRFGERYASSALNERMMGLPPGVYRGFDPVVVGNTVELRVSDYGDSIFTVESSGDVAHPLARVETTVTLDFTGHTVWPVWILAEANYTLGAPTTADIKTVRIEEIIATVPAGPNTVDLSTVLAPANLPVRPGTVTIAVTLNGGAPATITDDGAGNLSGTGLSGAGTIDYTTGAMTGTTQTLQGTTDLVLTYRWSDLGSKQILICKVDKPGAVLTVDATMPDNRMEPLAYAGGFGFGFMPDGSLEDLQAANLITAEVTQARTGFLQTFADLDTRLDAELAGGGTNGMAGRLALRGKMIETKVWDTSITPDERYWSSADPGWSGTGASANVSDDFKDKTRSTGPTVKGIVTDDDEHDHVRLMDRDFREFTDNSGLQVYGRLSYNPDVAQAEFTLTDDGITGITFNKSAKNVVGAGTQFTTEIQDGDLIEGADNNWYTVDTVNDDTHLDLLENYSTGVGTESAIDRHRRRYTMSFYTWDQGSSPEEQSYSFTSATEFRYWFQELFDADDQTVYADAVDIRQKGYAASTLATTDKVGVVELATDGETGPSVVVQGNDTRLSHPINAQDSGGTPIGGAPFSTIRSLSNVLFTNPAAGILGVAAAGSAGTDHSLLSNLAFAASGHTGFAPSATGTGSEYQLKFYYGTSSLPGVWNDYSFNLSSAGFTRVPLLIIAHVGTPRSGGINGGSAYASIGGGFVDLSSGSGMCFGTTAPPNNDYTSPYVEAGKLLSLCWRGNPAVDYATWAPSLTGSLPSITLNLTHTPSGTEWDTSTTFTCSVIVVGQ